MTDYFVLEWMTPNPITISPRTTLSEANRIMKDHRVRRLPVVDEGRLVGIITTGDLREAAPSMATSLSVFELTYLLDKVSVDKIMRRNVITVSPKTSVRDAAEIMLQNKISGLPVVDMKRVVGIITESDLFRMMVRDLTSEAGKAPTTQNG